MTIVVSRRWRDYLAGYDLPVVLPPPDGSVRIVKLAPGVSFEEMRMAKFNNMKAKANAAKTKRAKLAVEAIQNAGEIIGAGVE